MRGGGTTEVSGCGRKLTYWLARELTWTNTGLFVKSRGIQIGDKNILVLQHAFDFLKHCWKKIKTLIGQVVFLFWFKDGSCYGKSDCYFGPRT